MTTLIPIEHVGRARRGLVLRRGDRLGEASPLAQRSTESFDDVLRVVAMGGTPPASLDFALWSLTSSRGSTPILSQVLLENVATAMAEAERAITEGHRAFKLKIRSREDAEIVTALRALAPSAILRVDANRAFASEALVPWDELARARVEWIEEPCADARAILRGPVPIALDESVAEDATSALERIASGRAVALVLKPTILGASETLRIAAACREHGGRVVVSHAFESEIGRRAAEELARRVAPHETHGLNRWEGIDSFRITTGGLSLRTLWEHQRADSALE